MCVCHCVICKNHKLRFKLEDSSLLVGRNANSGILDRESQHDTIIRPFGSIDVYAYRMPITPLPLAEGVIDGQSVPDATAVIAGDSEGDAN